MRKTQIVTAFRKFVRRHTSRRTQLLIRRHILREGGIKADGKNFLLVTLDSCRYDTYVETPTPNFDRIAPVQWSLAPANFTLPSHIAMFYGFTPGDPSKRESLVNPNAGKFWKVAHVGSRRDQRNLMTLDARNVIDGYNKAGYVTLGTGAAGWFNPDEASCEPLVRDFQAYYYPGDYFFLRKQLDFVVRTLDKLCREAPFFAFVNVGETHFPYWHQGADWDRVFNPCRPFDLEGTNDAAECRRRQCACLRFVDSEFEMLFANMDLDNTHVLICADHGDCWGEDGLWGHTITHPKVLEVPLVYRLCTPFDA